MKAHHLLISIIGSETITLYITLALNFLSHHLDWSDILVFGLVNCLTEIRYWRYWNRVKVLYTWRRWEFWNSGKDAEVWNVNLWCLVLMLILIGSRIRRDICHGRDIRAFPRRISWWAQTCLEPMALTGAAHIQQNQRAAFPQPLLVSAINFLLLLPFTDQGNPYSSVLQYGLSRNPQSLQCQTAIGTLDLCGPINCRFQPLQ